MHVHIDQPRCVAAGQCVSAAPDVFDQRDDDGIVVLLQTDPAPDRRADVEFAASVCPAMAIRVEP